MRAAVVQMTSGDDLAVNLEQAERFIREARSVDADLIALPENFAFLRREGQPIPCAQAVDGEIIGRVRTLARELEVWILAGTFPEAVPGEARIHNTSVLISDQGELAGVYRKIHLFDVDLRSSGGDSYTESATVAAGQEVVVVKASFGTVGLSICYDLRFPELYRALVDRGARFVTVPSAFTPHTGRDHWETLLRARAVENQVFVIAPAQWGRHNPERSSHGRSMIVDPWGTVLATAPDRPGVILAECSLEEQDRVRRSLPCLEHRRL